MYTKWLQYNHVFVYVYVQECVCVCVCVCGGGVSVCTDCSNSYITTHVAI